MSRIFIAICFFIYLSLYSCAIFVYDDDDSDEKDDDSITITIHHSPTLVDPGR